MARAFGSYPKCHWFKSSRRYHSQEAEAIPPLGNIILRNCSRPAWATWPVGQVVKTPPFHGGNTGSSPVRVTTWRHSSAGRALASHARGHRFEFCCLHQNPEAVRLQDFFIGPGNGKRDDGGREETLNPVLGRRDESPSSREPQCVSVLCFFLFATLE